MGCTFDFFFCTILRLLIISLLLFLFGMDSCLPLQVSSVISTRIPFPLLSPFFDVSESPSRFLNFSYPLCVPFFFSCYLCDCDFQPFSKSVSLTCTVILMIQNIPYFTSILVLLRLFKLFLFSFSRFRTFLNSKCLTFRLITSSSVRWKSGGHFVRDVNVNNILTFQRSTLYVSQYSFK